MLTGSIWSRMAGASAVTAAVLAALGIAAGGWLAAEDGPGKPRTQPARGKAARVVVAPAEDVEFEFGFAEAPPPPDGKGGPPPFGKGGPPPFGPNRKGPDGRDGPPPPPPDRKGGPDEKRGPDRKGGPDEKRGPVTHVVRLEKLPDAETMEKAKKALGERGSLTPDAELKVVILRGEREQVHTAARILHGDVPPEHAIELVRLHKVEADKVAKLVTAVLPKGLEILARPAAKAVIFEGPAELVDQAVHLARQLDGPPREGHHGPGGPPPFVPGHAGPPPHIMIFKDEGPRDVLFRRAVPPPPPGREGRFEIELRRGPEMVPGVRVPLPPGVRVEGPPPAPRDVRGVRIERGEGPPPPPAPRGRPFRVETPDGVEIELDGDLDDLPPELREKLERLLQKRD